uniref:Polycomb group ring finger 1 n=1 Tax=Oryzias sinensis TaxID=183150 RepID=A0A8C8DMD8_9TELE
SKEHLLEAAGVKLLGGSVGTCQSQIPSHSVVWSLQQKFVRCSVRAEVRHLRKVLCHRLNVQMLFNNESLPDHMTMKRLWLSHWFGKSQPLVLHYTIKDKRSR